MPPLLTDKYPDLESKLIPLIIEGIKIPYLTTINHTSIVTPREYPNVTANSQIEIQCLKSNKDSWDQKLKSLVEIFKAKGIPMEFGAQKYISVINHSDPEYCSFRINVSLIDLDRLLESESTLYQQSGNRNALYENWNQKGIDGFLPHKIIKAINNTIFDKEGYPVAYLVKPSNAFCLAFDADGDASTANAFHDFYLLFEDLCKKHNIKLLPNATKYATSRTVSNSSIVKYEFNILPADMENLLLSECPNYAAYRGAASINRLAAPESADIKDGVICLFPAMLLDDEVYVPRNAGCNMSEIISVQLANYIKKYVLSDADVPKEDFFGHHNSKLTGDFLKIDANDIFSTLEKCMNIDELHRQQADGTRPLAKADTPLIQTCELTNNEDAIRIYQRYAAVTHTELEQLKSCEIHILDFLVQLREVVNHKIPFLSERNVASPSSYTHQSLENEKTAILKIDELTAAIKHLSNKIKV